jgi:hypothetical protein
VSSSPRSGEQVAVLSFWEDEETVRALATSESYQQAVPSIAGAGFTSADTARPSNTTDNQVPAIRLAKQRDIALWLLVPHYKPRRPGTHPGSVAPLSIPTCLADVAGVHASTLQRHLARTLIERPRHAIRTTRRDSHEEWPSATSAHTLLSTFQNNTRRAKEYAKNDDPPAMAVHSNVRVRGDCRPGLSRANGHGRDLGTPSVGNQSCRDREADDGEDTREPPCSIDCRIDGAHHAGGDDASS